MRKSSGWLIKFEFWILLGLDLKLNWWNDNFFLNPVSPCYRWTSPVLMKVTRDASWNCIENVEGWTQWGLIRFDESDVYNFVIVNLFTVDRNCVLGVFLLLDCYVLRYCSQWWTNYFFWVNHWYNSLYWLWHFIEKLRHDYTWLLRDWILLFGKKIYFIEKNWIEFTEKYFYK